MYAIYHKDFIPEAQTGRDPKHPFYVEGVYGLFGQTLEVLTGTPATDIVDLTVIPGSSESGLLTNDELDVLVDQLIASEATGREIQLSKSQAHYLYDTRFKPEEVEL